MLPAQVRNNWDPQTAGISACFGAARRSAAMARHAASRLRRRAPPLPAPAASPPSPGCPATPPLQRRHLPPPLVAEFDCSEAGARERFEAHQRARCFNLHTSGVLDAATGLSTTAAYLPFWLFDAVVSTEAKATLGHRPDGCAGGAAQRPAKRRRRVAH